VRYWTVDEAREYLPRLRLLLGVIRRASHLAVSAKGNGHATLPGAPRPAGPVQSPTPSSPTPPTATSAPNEPPAPPATSAPNEPPAPPATSAPNEPPAPAPPSPSSEAAPEPAVSFDVKEALEELEQQGIVLRDADRGLIDFPALHTGREVLLCWQLGEDDLEWWHLPEDGFAGRRPLPLPPEL